ncbi:MAG TPA: DUF2130 domain-containing protein [Puia sp.]|nr:DUF2130 domain-containing protein [Puia sp.]
MATDIKCPNCGHQFPMEDAVAEQYKKDLREQMISFNKKKEEEYQLKLAEVSRQLQQQQENFNKKLADEKKQWQQSIEENVRKTISADFENQLHLLKQSNKDNEEKLKTARQKELEFLQKEQELINKQAEFELSVQRKMQEERIKLSEEIRNLEEQRIAARETEYQMQMEQLKKQLEDQKKLVDEMKRKAEQGSTQMQGEVQELVLEELLKTSFPFDLVSEVPKGIKGADCIQLVRNEFGQECGKIIYESKRTNAFSQDWIEKLKADMRSQGAQVAIIVTRAMPKDMNGFGEKNGVLICSFSEVKALAYVMRDNIIRIFNVSKSQQNKGDKMQMLYDYITSSEFGEQWKAIREGFLSMKNSIQKERDTMEKLWKAREKQLEKVLLNASYIKGSMEGIAGQDSLDMNLLDEPSNGELELE